MHQYASTTPGAIIGYTSRGPIRLIAGGSGEGDGGQPDGQPPAGGTPPQGGQPDPAGQPDGQNGDSKDTPFDGPFDPERAARLIENLRAEAKAAKDNATKAAEDARKTAAEEFKSDLAKALGLVKDGEGEAADAAKVAAERDKAAAEARQYAVELAVYRAAGQHGADATALLDSRTFLDGLKDVDPSDSAKVGDAIKAAVEANPKLSVTAPAGQAPASRGGAEPSGRPGQPQKAKNLQDAIAAKYGGT